MGITMADEDQASRWRSIDDYAMSGRPVILAVVCAGRQPVIGEARFYEEYDDWYWAGAAPDDWNCPGGVKDVNFGLPLYYQVMPELPKILHEGTRADEGQG